MPKELSLKRRIARFVVGVPVAILIATSLFTPWTWQWGTANLQVRFRNESNAQMNVGSAGCGAGWSKFSLVIGDWDRRCEMGSWRGNGLTIADKWDARIAGVSPRGVSIQMRYWEKINEKIISFNRVIFVPAYQTARIDISPGMYITGAFE
jgi:hypothetical protein